MKNFIFIILIFITTISCNKNLETANKLEGSWEMTKSSLNNVEDDNPNGKGTIIMFSKYNKDNGIIEIEYKNIYVGSYKDTGLYSILNEGEMLKVEIGGTNQSFNFTLEGNELHLNSIDNPGSATNIYIKK